MIAYLRKPGNWENFLRILPALLSRNIKSVPRMNQVELFYLITKRPFILTRLDDSSVWYIVDGRDPDIVEAKTILTCSPLKAHYKEFNKKIPTVHKLFKEWGGIPRYVLVGVLDMDIQHQLKDAIGLCDEKIFRYIGGSDSKDDVSRKLVHIWTNLPAER
ncbi:uncharacterized protein OCT59_009939 [Rhizophagus irregularis]|uniref:uncharacterized protein n=1 Tax=Rhizophagus irregularis TaxID=588596 RepID=UPI0033224F5A|nr:hypothetical protein OCT59_009939 [Rhizophagus irregularis]